MLTHVFVNTHYFTQFCIFNTSLANAIFIYRLRYYKYRRTIVVHIAGILTYFVTMLRYWIKVSGFFFELMKIYFAPILLMTETNAINEISYNMMLFEMVSMSITVIGIDVGIACVRISLKTCRNPVEIISRPNSIISPFDIGKMLLLHHITYIQAADTRRSDMRGSKTSHG